VHRQVLQISALQIFLREVLFAYEAVEKPVGGGYIPSLLIKVLVPVFCRRTNVVLRIVMSTITVVSLVSSLPPLFLHDDFASRHLHIQLLRNDYTVPTRCRHRGGIVDPLGCKACRAIRQPISPSTQIQDRSIQNHPKPVSFLSSGVSLESSPTPLNPTITHT
jgi:hypothetical protein